MHLGSTLILLQDAILFRTPVKTAEKDPSCVLKLSMSARTKLQSLMARFSHSWPLNDLGKDVKPKPNFIYVAAFTFMRHSAQENSDVGLTANGSVCCFVGHVSVFSSLSQLLKVTVYLFINLSLFPLTTQCSHHSLFVHVAFFTKETMQMLQNCF